jgi:hypothetical protein
MNSSMCNKIFNRSFIRENKIKCLEGVPGEDTYFSMTAFLKSSNVYYIPKVMYYYRQRSSSVSWGGTANFFNGMNEDNTLLEEEKAAILNDLRVKYDAKKVSYNEEIEKINKAYEEEARVA